MDKVEKALALAKELKKILEPLDVGSTVLEKVQETLLEGRCKICWHKIEKYSQCWNCYESPNSSGD